MAERKRIIVSASVRAKIRKVFKVTDQTVYRMLRYESNSPLADKVRTYALKNEGQEVRFTK